MQQMSLREYIDSLERDGYTVRDDHGDDPVLIRPDGRAVETWREDYPYDELMDRDDYEVEKYRLQIELLKLQYWAEDSGRRHVIVFEGRDAAGKGGTIKRFMEHLNPRAARVVALTKPTTTEQGQWYFQRYVQHFPTAGEIVLFDRSWYNRAGRRAGDGLLHRRRVPHLHAPGAGVRGMLVETGVHVTKLWFSVTRRSSAPASRSARSTRSGGGSCRRWTSSRSTGGSRTPTPRRRCSPAPTPTTHRGSRSGATTRSAPGSTRCATSSSQFSYDGKDRARSVGSTREIVQRGRETVRD